MKDKFLAILIKVLQYGAFVVFLLLSLSAGVDSFMAGLVLAMPTFLILPTIREKYLSNNLRHPLFTIFIMTIAVFISMRISETALKKDAENQQQEIAIIEQQEKEKALASFLAEPRSKIDEIKNFIEQGLYNDARNEINYYVEVENQELKAIDLQLSELEEKIRREQQVEAEKIAEEQRLLKAATLWSYSHTDDPMSKGVTHTAYIQSSNTVSFDFPYQGPQNGRLILRTDPKHGKDVMFGIENGQILCSTYDGCNVLVRFDDEDPISYSAVGAADNSTETIFIQNYSRFVGKLMKAKRVRISVNIYQEGSPVFDFDISGFNKEKYQSKN